MGSLLVLLTSVVALCFRPHSRKKFLQAKTRFPQGVTVAYMCNPAALPIALDEAVAVFGPDVLACIAQDCTEKCSLPKIGSNNDENPAAVGIVLIACN
eukprot:2781088-Amphidinium_carterae.1